MPSYVIAGASRGLGWGFVQHLSEQPNNTVFALVRDVEATNTKVKEQLSGRTNVHVVRGDLLDRASLEDAVRQVSAVTGGTVDVLIANAGLTFAAHMHVPIGESLTGDPAQYKNYEQEMLECFQTNTLGTARLLALFAPLVAAGDTKKVAVLSSGSADLDWLRDSGWIYHSAHVVSKVALTGVLLNFHNEYKNKGVLFVAVSPGVVDTGFHNESYSPEWHAALADMIRLIGKTAPHFKAPSTPVEAAEDVCKLIDRATVAEHGGRLVSRFGDKKWP